jgi:hypothetical protein
VIHDTIVSLSLCAYIMKRHPHEKAVGIVDKMEEMSTIAERSDWVLVILGSGNIIKKIRIY